MLVEIQFALLSPSFYMSVFLALDNRINAKRHDCFLAMARHLILYIKPSKPGE